MSLNLKRMYNLSKIFIISLINKWVEKFSFGLYFRPDRVDIRFTFRCNLRCRHCPNWPYSFNELDTDMWKKIIFELRKWLGPFNLNISGGEPLIKDDIFELIAFSKRLGVFTNLNTNGTLIDEHVAEKLIKSGLNLLSISLDGLEDTHDYIRGKYTYKKAIKAINYFRNRLILQINTTILNCNLDDILKLVEYADNNRIGILFQGFLCGRSHPLLINSRLDNLWPKDVEKIRSLFDRLILKKKNNSNIINSTASLKLLKSYYTDSGSYNKRYSCQAYKNNFTIFPDGNVRICVESGWLGNLNFKSPRQIWNSKEFSKKRKKMKKCHYPCAFLSCRLKQGILEMILSRRYALDRLLKI